MHELHTDIEIVASPQQIWDVLTDFAAYARWNPFIRQIYGDPREGSALEVCIRPPGSRRARIRPVVVVADAPRELGWRAHLLLSEVLEVEHRFLLGSLGCGEVRFEQTLRLRGLITPLLRNSVERNVCRGVREMNAALKGRVERACECAARAALEH